MFSTSVFGTDSHRGAALI